jgi:hypothetical protein
MSIPRSGSTNYEVAAANKMTADETNAWLEAAHGSPAKL